MVNNPAPVASILQALHFAARKHRDQRRKGVEASPYVNHLIEVAEILALAGISDLLTLQGAILHDTIEDTRTTPEELENAFGVEVRRLVQEVSDDKSLPKEERKRLQVEHAPNLSMSARLIKIADKIANIRSVVHVPPPDWSADRRREYLDWTERVVAGCRGSNVALERLYDESLEQGRRLLAAASA